MGLVTHGAYIGLDRAFYANSTHVHRFSAQHLAQLHGSVQDKRYSRFIEVAQRQYSGNAHAVVTGIGLANLVHCSGAGGNFLPLDFRVYAPGRDGLTKDAHFQAMFQHVVAEGTIQAHTLLFGSWYASSEDLKVIHRAGWTFFTTRETALIMHIARIKIVIDNYSLTF